MNALRKFEESSKALQGEKRSWLVSGVAGFIGSNLLECLLQNDQMVRGLDNFSTGHRKNLDAVRHSVGEEKWSNFSLIEGDVSDYSCCASAMSDVDLVLHQAALGSVPRSIKDPLATNESNVTGFLNLLQAAKESGVSRFVYAASSSTYGDSRELPKREDNIGKPLSPYAVSKYVNELYGQVFSDVYDIEVVGLRYFNVFGFRQDATGAYAAVIPRWAEAMLQGEDVVINGDGYTSRDFCFVENVVLANVLAATVDSATDHNVYNIAYGQQTTLLDLFHTLKEELRVGGVEYGYEPIFRNFREGDVRHSLADISRARRALGYSPPYSFSEGMSRYVADLLSTI